MDRFAVRLALGYVSAEEEVGILTAQALSHPLDSLAARVSVADVRQLKDAVKAVRISDELKRYAVDIVRASRDRPSVQLGAGPRAALALARLAQALALIDGSGFVTPDHIREMAVPVLAHRLVLDPQAKFSGVTSQQVVADVLRAIRVPA
jgi:MoxR-like ATPase